jgi:hypothetical protein
MILRHRIGLLCYALSAVSCGTFVLLQTHSLDGIAMLWYLGGVFVGVGIGLFAAPMTIRDNRGA